MVLARVFSSDTLTSNGFIVVSNDFNYAIGIIKESFSGDVTIFPKPFKEQKDMLVDDVEELMESAYLTGDERLFIIKSDSYSAIVQNKLLKLLEEPPNGVKFCLLVASKAALLPTVRSRLSECEIKTKKNSELESVDFSKIDANFMFETLKKSESMSKEEAKEYLYALLQGYVNVSKKNEPYKNSQKLDIFDTAFKLLTLNTPPKIVFSALLAKVTAK